MSHECYVLTVNVYYSYTETLKYLTEFSLVWLVLVLVGWCWYGLLGFGLVCLVLVCFGLVGFGFG